MFPNMKATTVFIIFCAIVSLTLSQANDGFYHQEYNYTSSSSSFKNNELQHKNEDSGHYSKDGDLSGRLKPKVNAYSQHSQYVNPKLQQNGYTSSSLGQGGGLYNQNIDLIGQRKADHLTGFQAGASYGASTSYQGNQFHGTANENLRPIAQRLQNQLSSQLQDAIYNQYQQSSTYSNSISNSQIQSDARELEDELKRNLTLQLQEALQTQFGSQGVRGGSYYSISNGHLQPSANYNNQELEDLTQQIQNNLNRELQEGIRTQYRTSSSQSSSSSATSSHNSNNPYGTTTYVQRPHYTNPDTEYVPVGSRHVTTGSQLASSNSDSELTSTGSRYPSSVDRYPSSGPHFPSSGSQYPSSSGAQYSLPSSSSSQFSSGSEFGTSSSGSRYPASSGPYYPSFSGTHYPSTGNLYPSLSTSSSGSKHFAASTSNQYTPITNSESITTIASKVQDNLDDQLNHLLEDTQRKYFTSNNYQFNSQSNWNNVLAQLEQDLKRNLTEQFDNELKRNYGTSYSYSNSNYNNQDYDNLKQQIERNLLSKLTRDFNRQKERYQQSYSSSSSSSSSSTGQIYGTQPDYTNYGNSHIKTGSHSRENSYNYAAGSRHSGYEVQQPSMSQVELSDIQRQLQDQLSRQLQAAISKNQYSNSHSASATTSYNPQQNYQTSLQHLTNELNRNLTEQLNTLLAQQYGSQYSQYGDSSSSSTSGSGGISSGSYSQLANLRNQLQNDLQKQLQQGLQQSYSKYSSWSSSSSTNYRPTRDFGPVTFKGGRHNGRNNAEMTCEDCMMGDDPNVYQNDQARDSLGSFNSDNYRLTYGYGQNSRGRYDHSRQQQIQLTYGEESSGGGYVQQQRQGLEIGQSQVTDDSDLTQQTENVGFGQQSDLTQQTEDIGFGNLEIGSQQRRNNYQHSVQQFLEFGQQTGNSDLTQQIEDVGFGKLEVGNQQKPNKPNRWQFASQNQQEADDSDLTQRTEDLGFQKLETLNQQNHDIPQETEDLGQQKVIDLEQDRDLTQQTEVPGFGKLEQQNENDPANQIVQETEDFTQQANQRRRNNYPHSVQQSIEFEQQTDDSDLTQQTEDIDSGKPHKLTELNNGNRPWSITNHQQQNSDLTQQQEQVVLEQQTDESDLTQQTEDIDFEKPNKLTETNHENRPWSLISQQQQLNSDLSQQQEQVLSGQQTGDSDLTQQTEHVGSGNLESGIQENLNKPQSESTQRYRPSQPTNEQHQQNGDSDLTQQQEQVVLGQQTDDSDLTQQVEDNNFGGPQIYNQQISSINEQQSNRIFRTQQHIQLTTNQDIPKITDQEEYEQPIETVISLNKTYNAGDLIIQNAEDVVDLDKISQDNVNNLMDQITNDFDKLNKEKQQIQNTNDEFDVEKLRKQQQLERALSHTELLINALKKKSQENHHVSPNYGGTYSSPSGGRTYQQQSRTQQGVRITYNPRIVHYPSSSSQTQQQITDNQEQLEDSNTFDQQQQQRQDDDVGFTTNYNTQQGSRSYSSSYNSYEVQHHSYDHQIENTQTDQDHIRPVPGIVHFGTPQQVDDEIIERAPEIEPIHPQQATVIEEVNHRKPVLGVKTNHRVAETPPNEEFAVNTDVEIIATTTEKPGFWTRLGNKVKDSAKSLKEKIVG